MNLVPSQSGKALRMRRLANAQSGKCLMVPLDHSLADGPIASPTRLRQLIIDIARNGGDAVVMHKGRARFLAPDTLGNLALVVHLNGCTRFSADSNAKALLSSVSDAVAAGADAVSVHINMGSPTETQQLCDLSQVASECQRWAMPLMAMIYPRGPGVEGQATLPLLMHAANLAAELGADIVKLPYANDLAAMSQVIAESPLPVLVAGGTKAREDQFIARVEDIMQAGAWGVAAGRNVFSAEQPGALVSRVAHCVHGERQSGALPLRPARVLPA